MDARRYAHAFLSQRKTSLRAWFLTQRAETAGLLVGGLLFFLFAPELGNSSEDGRNRCGDDRSTRTGKQPQRESVWPQLNASQTRFKRNRAQVDLLTEKTIRVINHTKSSADGRYSGGDFDSGYHTVRIKGQTFKGQRNNEERLSHLDFDFADKVVLDIGCNIGGMLHALGGDIKHGVGVDFDAKCINAANMIASVNGANNLKFFTFDLDKENIYKLWDFVPHEKVDVCFFLALVCWVDNWKGVIDFCAKVSDNLLFETNAHPEDLKKESIEYVKTVYRDVRVLRPESPDDPITQGRVMLWCSNPTFGLDDSLEALKNIEKGAVDTTAVEPLATKGCQRRTYLIRGEGKDYFLGVGGKRNGADYAASKFLKAKNAPVVDTIISSEDKNGTPYIIREYKKSTTLKELRESTKHVRDALRSKKHVRDALRSKKHIKDALRGIAAIHSIKASGFGFIDETTPDGDVAGGWKTWTEFLEFLVSNEAGFLRDNGIISREEYDELFRKYELYFSKYKKLLDTSGCFLLGDINWSNILIDANGKAHFTDLEFAMIGDPAFEFSCMRDYSAGHLAYYAKERRKRDSSFDKRVFRKKVTLYEPLKMLFVASYASARNGRSATARYQYERGLRKLNALVDDGVFSTVRKGSNFIKSMR